MRSSASSQETTRNPRSPFRRSIGSGSRPSARSSRDVRDESDDTSASADGSSAGAVLSRISSRRTMQRCVPSSVQSDRPDVPSAQPSHTPSLRIRHANGRSSRLSHTSLSISR